MQKIIFLTFTLVCSWTFSFQSLAAAPWDLNDVSYLMPFPTSVLDNKLLRQQSLARGGELLPPRMLTRIPPLALHIPAEEQQKVLRVVAARIDPCFPLPTPMSCQKQIRLVWQPFEEGRNRQVMSVDAALHTFYVLSDQEFDLLLQDLQQWREKFAASTKFQPLQVHPAWAKDGDKSASLREFQSVLTKYAGEENLTRITVMVLRGAGNMWAFAGFEPSPTGPKLLPVPRLGTSQSQSFVNFGVPADHFQGGGIGPKPVGDDTLNTLVTESAELGPDKEDLILQETRAIFRIENPRQFNPENMDCVSCHVAQPAKHWVLNKRPHLGVDKAWAAETYANAKYNLENTTPEIWNTLMIRGFGYFGKHTAISQRVINESAEVADAINAYIAGKKN